MRSPIRLALVGLGAIGLTAHLPALLRSPLVEVVGLVDPDAGRRSMAAELVGPDVPTYAEATAVCGATAVDGVVLATPPWVTAGLVAVFLQSGKYVLAEKPVATSAAAAAEIAALPVATVRRLQVGLTYRHDPALAQLREWIRCGPLDGPLLIRAHIYDERLDPADPDHAARIRETLAHGPPVLHEGAHVFDWLAYLLDGRPARLADAWTVCTIPSLGAPNLNGARLEYAEGTTALVEFGWLTDELPRCELSVLSQHAHAVLDGSTFRLSVTTAAGTQIVDEPVDRTIRCFDRQLAAFVRLVTGAVETPMPGFAEGLASLRLAEQVVHLAASGDRDRSSE